MALIMQLVPLTPAVQERHSESMPVENLSLRTVGWQIISLLPVVSQFAEDTALYTIDPVIW